MHWTYTEFAQDSDLEQGDVLVASDALRDVLSEVHPHFCAEKYLGFTIATQSCDLVRRKGHPCKARYVSIAVIRSLKDVLPKLVAQVVRPVAPGLFRSSSKALARQLLERLFDQNEQALGLFYFHQDAEVGLGEPCVGFLRIKVALRAQHYDVLLGSRTGRLNAEFRSKFGWLLGNLYSRAASPDWSDIEGGKKQLEQMIDRSLRQQIPGAGPLWVDDDLVESGRAAGVLFENRNDHENLLKELEEHRPKPRVEQLVDVIVREAVKILDPKDEERVRVLRNTLLNNSFVNRLMKK